MLKVIVGDENIVMTRYWVIEYQGATWFVPEWIEEPRNQVCRPARIIQLDLKLCQDLRANSLPLADFLLTLPVPRAVLDGASKSTGGFVVIEEPPLQFEMDVKLQ